MGQRVHESRHRPTRWLLAYWGPFAFLLMGAILIALLAALRTPEVSSQTLQNFFGLAIQVNASLLLGVFVMASFLLPRIPEPRRAWYASALTLDAGIFFIGIMSSTLGFLLPSFAAEHAFNLTVVVLSSWFLGLALLVDGTRLSRQVTP